MKMTIKYVLFLVICYNVLGIDSGIPSPIFFKNVLGEHRSTTPLALELSKVLLYSVQNFFWFPVSFLIAYLHRHMSSPKERSFFFLPKNVHFHGKILMLEMIFLSFT